MKKTKERKKRATKPKNKSTNDKKKSLIKKNKNKQQQTNKKKPDTQNPRTNGKSKAIQTKSHKEAYTYTLTKREQGKICIYHCSQSPPPQFWDDSLSIQVFQ